MQQHGWARVFKTSSQLVLKTSDCLLKLIFTSIHLMENDQIPKNTFPPPNPFLVVCYQLICACKRQLLSASPPFLNSVRFLLDFYLSTSGYIRNRWKPVLFVFHFNFGVLYSSGYSTCLLESAKKTFPQAAFHSMDNYRLFLHINVKYFVVLWQQLNGFDFLQVYFGYDACFLSFKFPSHTLH